jgi:hypothetical protein
MKGDWYQIRKGAGTGPGAGAYTIRAGAIHDGMLVPKARGWCQPRWWASAKYERALVPKTTGGESVVKYNRGQVQNMIRGRCQIRGGLVLNTKGGWCQ